MININGKEFKINLDLKWGTEKLVQRVMDNPQDPKVDAYMTAVFKDMLIPPPTAKEMFNFRRSDTERIFKQFAKEMKELNADLKKKHSQ